MLEGLAKKLLRVLCPYLKDMAARTENKIDDLVVRVLCAMVGDDSE